jgi:hypothetical protein
MALTKLLSCASSALVKHEHPVSNLEGCFLPSNEKKRVTLPANQISQVRALPISYFRSLDESHTWRFARLNLFLKLRARKSKESTTNKAGLLLSSHPGTIDEASARKRKE